MNIKKLFITLGVLLISLNSIAQDATLKDKKSWYVPDYASLQFAGNIGFLSIGAGYEIFDDVWYAELLYGYSPRSITAAESNHLITIKNTFPIFTKELSNSFSISPIAGIAITYDAGNNTFTSLPGQFPKGYYISNAIHLTIFGGFKVHKDFKNDKIFKGIDMYYELGTVESYLWYAITSSEFSMSDAFSSAIGVNLYF